MPTVAVSVMSARALVRDHKFCFTWVNHLSGDNYCFLLPTWPGRRMKLQLPLNTSYSYNISRQMCLSGYLAAAFDLLSGHRLCMNAVVRILLSHCEMYIELGCLDKVCKRQKKDTSIAVNGIHYSCFWAPLLHKTCLLAQVFPLYVVFTCFPAGSADVNGLTAVHSTSVITGLIQSLTFH